MRRNFRLATKDEIQRAFALTGRYLDTTQAEAVRQQLAELFEEVGQ
jgi:hypothetical protein